MPAKYNTAILDKATAVTNGVEYTTDEILFRGVRGAVAFVLLEGTGGSVDVDVFVFDQWVSLKNGTLVDGVMFVLDIDFFPTRARVRVTPSGVGGTLSVQINGYPEGGGDSDN